MNKEIEKMQNSDNFGDEEAAEEALLETSIFLIK
jgi:hypothetical protein